MDELKEDKVIAIFAISTLLVSVTGSNFGKELKEKYNTLKNEFKEKYQQLRISKISELKEDTSDNVKSSLSDDEKIELEIKRKELLLLEHEFRENIKNLN